MSDLSRAQTAQSTTYANGWKAGDPILPSEALEGFPVLAALDTGGFVVLAWNSASSDPDAPGYPLRAEIHSAEGVKIGAEVQIPSAKDGNLHSVVAAGLPGGGFVVVSGDLVIREGEEPGDDLFVQIFDGSGNAVGERTQVNTTTSGHQIPPQIAVLADGSFVVLWTHWEGNWPDQDGALRGQLFTADGDRSGGEFLMTPTAIFSQEAPAIASMPGGGFVTTWLESPFFGEARTIKVQLFDNDANRIGQSVVVASGEDYVFAPDVAALAGGNYVVTWTVVDSAGLPEHNSTIYGQMLAADGSKVGGVLTIAQTAQGGRGTTSIAALQDGGFTVTWQDPSADGDGTGILTRFFDGSGAAHGEAILVNVLTAEDQRDAAVITLAWGGIAVAWGDYGGATPGNGSTIAARIFSPLGFAAADDAFATDEATIRQGNVFGDNGSGGDSAPDSGTLFVSAVNGSASAVGQQIKLDSGALLTLSADGSYLYDPNHAFDALAATGTGGSNTVDTDSFTYAIAGGGTATVTVTVSGLYSAPHVVEGTANANSLTGTAEADMLYGREGDDSIAAGGGNDLLDGGAGDDLLFGGEGNDTLITGGTGDGKDVASGGAGNDDLYADYGTVHLLGEAGDDFLIFNGSLDPTDIASGGEGNDTLVLRGGEYGALTLSGAFVSGIETVMLREGLEAALYPYSIGTADDLVGAGGLLVLEAGALREGENFSFDGLAETDGRFDVRGGAGADLIVAGAGNDVLNGGAGDDYLVGGGGNDAYFVDALRDTVVEDAGEGTDTVSTFLGDPSNYSQMYTLPDNVENLIGTAASGQGVYGNALDNLIKMAGGNDLVVLADGGNDRVEAGAGADFLYFGGTFTNADSVDGGAGSDTVGLVGNYSIAFDADDLVSVEKLAVYSSGDSAAPAGYTLTTNDLNVAAGQTMTIIAQSLQANELLAFNGSAETNGSFNVKGGRGADTITGGAGADVIWGNLGADTLRGGAGNDSFVYQSTAESTAAARDLILDFAWGDRVVLLAIDPDGDASNGNGKFAFIGSDAFHQVAGELRVTQDAVYNRAWLVEGDTDGDGAADFSLYVVAQPGQVIGANDFLL
ncbi:MAG TPA: VCBS domain-containing protein [Allosphingosinicella sp.]